MNKIAFEKFVTNCAITLHHLRTGDENLSIINFCPVGLANKCGDLFSLKQASGTTLSRKAISGAVKSITKKEESQVWVMKKLP